MRIGRREFIGAGAAVFGVTALRPSALLAQSAAPELRSMTADVVPIARDEYRARITKAQRLMREQGLSALLIEPGASLVYFTGVQWWRSERLTAAVLPVEGEPIVVTPHFEEPSVRESLKIPAEVRIWNEHENPLAVVAGFLRDRRLTGPVGIEETVRFFAVQGLREVMPNVAIRPGAPVVRGCRMIKSAHELALMQKASDLTIAAYRHTAPRIQRGMRPSDVSAIMNNAAAALGSPPGFALVLLRVAT